MPAPPTATDASPVVRSQSPARAVARSSKQSAALSLPSPAPASSSSSSSSSSSHNAAAAAAAVAVANEYTRSHLHGPALAATIAVVAAAHGYFFYLLYLDHVDVAAAGALATAVDASDYVALVVPLFFASIFVEAAYSYYYKLSLYRLNDSVGSLATGSVMSIAGRVWAGPLTELASRVAGAQVKLVPYVYIWRHFRVRAVSDHFEGVSGFIAMFFVVEFVYYWIHRTGHTLHAGWAMHGVHHTSEEYNLSTALRQSTLHSLVSWAYYVLPALFFPPVHYMLQAQFNLLYQFWIHTCAVPKLGVLELVFNTPSQHRVHHGRNPYCIDKNYGGTLCIFDRAFGTFEEERYDEPPVFGVTHGLESFDPLWANWELWRPMLGADHGCATLKDRLARFYYGPGWVPQTYSPPEQYDIPPISRAHQQKFDPKLPRAVNVYVFVQYALCMLLTKLIMDNSLPLVREHCIATSLFATFAICSATLVCNRASIAPYTEIAKHIVVIAVLVSQLRDSPQLMWPAVAVCGVFVAWIARYTALFRVPLSDAEIGRDLTDDEVAQKQRKAR